MRKPFLNSLVGFGISIGIALVIVSLIVVLQGIGLW